MSIRDQAIVAFRDFVDETSTAFKRIGHNLIYSITFRIISHLELMPAIEGAKSSSAFARKHLLETPVFKTRKRLFAHCLEQAPEDGLHMEFGVFKADSINLLAKLRRDVTWYGFDSFEGLPEGWTLGMKKGAFDLGGLLPARRANVDFVKGWFNESLPPFCKEHADKTVAFLHVDCDIYSSTVTILEELAPMIRAGTVIVFDEYFNYADWLDGEYKAFMEYCEKHGVLFEYIGYIRDSRQVAVRIKEL